MPDASTPTISLILSTSPGCLRIHAHEDKRTTLHIALPHASQAGTVVATVLWRL